MKHKAKSLRLFYFSISVLALLFSQAFAASVIFPSVTAFGKVSIGQTKNVLFTVKNNTSQSVRLDSNWLANANPYKISGGTCQFNQSSGFILAGLNTCTLDIKFSPVKLGIQNNTLVLGYFLGTGWTWQEANLALSGEGISSTTTPPPPPTTTGWLKVQGNKIVNDQGQQIILKGINIADPEILDTKPWERPNVTAKSIAAMATDQYFAKVVRLPILPGNSSYPNEGFLNTQNGYDIYFKNHIEPLVNELTSKGIYVIIDLHYVSDYQNLYPKVSAFWTYMAPKFKNNPKVLYEIFNEPILPDSWSTWKNTIAQPATNLIRSLAPNNLILVGGPYWSSHMAGAATDPIAGNNIVYIGHVYSNQSSTMWDQRYGPVIAKYPMIITEWGFETGGTEGGDIIFGQNFEAWMSKNNLGWTAWCFDTNWGPKMFNSDWSLKGGTGGMGVFVKDLLIQNHLK